jgi:uncharacterized repeat protein (TIGR01451 family)
MKLFYSIFLILTFLLFSSTHLYAASTNYVDVINEPILLTSTGYDDNTHEASKNDIIYYMFKLDEDGDVTITVNDIITSDSDTPRFNFSTSGYPSTDWDTGSTTETFTGMAEDDIIYVGVLYDSLPSATAYSIVATLTTVAALDSNLTITKTSSDDIVSINGSFYYTINITNIGIDVASDINVTDILPTDMDFNTTATNDNSPYWNCSEVSGTVTCEHNASNLSAGETHTILLHVTAPSTPGDIENNATVIGIINSISHSSTASETTVISADVDNAENVCYIENSVVNYGNSYTLLEAACDKKGNFYYGEDCIASVIIVDTNASEDSILELTVSKMYAPGLDHGTASTTDGDLPLGDGPSSLNITEYSSYTEGYVVYNAELTNDNNFTITDENSYNNGGKLYGIALYADYNITGVHHSGRIYTCSGASEGNIEITTAADVIDTPIGNSATIAGYYNASTVPNPVLPSSEIPNTNIKYIQTMVANFNNRKISGVHLDLGGTATVWDYNGSETTLPYSVIPYLTDDTCTASLGNIIDPNTSEQLVIDIAEGQYSAEGTMIVSDIARELARIQTIFVNPNGLSVEGQNCLTNSSTTGNFARLAQCVNSTVQYKTAFGQDAWDRCGSGNGSPCESSNHGYSCGEGVTSCPGYNQIYDNELGCYMCTFNITASCSTDNFAIRPDNFNSTIVPNQIFTAGTDTPLTFYANKFAGTGTPDYNEAENSSFVVDVNISDSSKSCQEMSINFDPTIDFTDGIVTDNYSLPNVGDFNVTMHETIGSEFALVDADDTNDTDRLITPFTQQIKVIPDHFAIDGNFTNGSDGFTYLNNFEANATLDQNISALMNWNVIAQAQDNNTTTNYTSTCYAKDGNITLDINTSQDISDLNQSLSELLWYDDENGTIIGSVSINDPLVLPNYTAQRFEPGDSNGTGNFRYRLNFDRNITKVVNPFLMTINDINVTDTDSVSGNSALDNNATYIYGRTHASTQRYFGPTGTANIYFEAYCFGSTCTKTLLNGFSPNLKRTDDIRWFYNEVSHDTSTDGNIGTVQEKDATPLNAADDVVDVTDQNDTNPSTASLEYDANGDGIDNESYPYITTMHNDASPWLIYNEYDPTATRNEFQVHFLSEGGWTGEHETDVTTKPDANVITNRRTMW